MRAVSFDQKTKQPNTQPEAVENAGTMQTLEENINPHTKNPLRQIEDKMKI